MNLPVILKGTSKNLPGHYLGAGLKLRFENSTG